jgi:hypothetical protein
MLEAAYPMRGTFLAAGNSGKSFILILSPPRV